MADAVKSDFWLMGEVIHGDYARWANERTLHSVTDYALHKALYSGHNDHNYFEIAHTVRRTMGLVPAHIKLYNFVDNHDVERISTKLNNKAHYLPVHILLYTLPGIPSLYYGSEFGIEGRKERYSDDSLRPCINLAEHLGDYVNNPCTRLIAALGAIHKEFREDLVWGDYRELALTTETYAYARGSLLVALNNGDKTAHFDLGADAPAYVGLLGGETIKASDGRIVIELPPHGGEIFAPVDENGEVAKTEAKHTVGSLGDVTWQSLEPVHDEAQQALPELPTEIPDIAYEDMTVEQLQASILAKMAANGPVTDRMRKDVTDNIWHDSLVSWVKSFR